MRTVYVQYDAADDEWDACLSAFLLGLAWRGYHDICDCLAAVAETICERHLRAYRLADVGERSLPPREIGVFDLSIRGWINYTAPFSATPVCSCDIVDLMRYGCRCGAIVRYAGGSR